MSNRNIIEYITTEKGMTQRKIAEKLRVTPAQISKWKAGESIPNDRKQQLMGIARLFGDDAEWAIFAETEEKSEQWFQYFSHFRDIIDTPAWMLVETSEWYVPRVLKIFDTLGVRIPETPTMLNTLLTEEYEFSDFDNLVLTFLENHGMLIRWIQNNVISEYQDYDGPSMISSEIEDLSFNVVVRWVEYELVTCGANQSTISKMKFDIDQEAKATIRDLYRELTKENIPWTTDVFRMLSTHPEILDDDEMLASLFETSIEDILPYGDKQILKHTKYCNALLEELHIKIDTLLSDESKKLLSDKLEHTKPLHNKILNGHSD